MGGMDDAEYYAQEAAMEEFIDKEIVKISIENIRNYLGQNGDAIDFRVKSCLTQADGLKEKGYDQSSFIMYSIAIEIIVRYFLIRPLMQGAFLKDEWAEFITQRITSGQSGKDREMLPKILEMHDIDIHNIFTKNGKPLWDEIVKIIIPKRNKIIHIADHATPNDSELASVCAWQIYEDVVMPLSKKLGFTIAVTGCWSRVGHTSDQFMWGRYITSDPFHKA